MKPLNRIRGRQISITIVRMGLLAATAFGFAGPSTPVKEGGRGGAEAKRVLYVVDVSPSMEATGGSGRLLEAARQEVRNRITALSQETLVEVMACPSGTGHHLEWLPAGRSSRIPERLRADPGVCSLPTLLRRVLPLLDGETEVVVVSDFQATKQETATLQEMARQEPRLEWVKMEGRAANLTLRELRGEQVLYAQVQNQERFAQDAELHVQCDKAEATVHATVPAEGTHWIPLEVPRGVVSGICTVTLSRDGFGADNQLGFVVDYRPTLSVAVVDSSAAVGGALPPAHFVESAFRAMKLQVSLTSMNQTELSLDVLSMADLVVWIDPMPLDPHVEAALESFLRRGGGLIVFAGSNFQAWPERSLLFRDLEVRPCSAVPERPFLLEWARNKSQWLEGVSGLSSEVLHSWNSLRHVSLTFLDETQEVGARFSDGAPMWIRMSRWAGKVALFTFVPDSENGNLAWHPLFPIVLSSLVDELSPLPTALTFPPECVVGTFCNLGAAGVMSRAFEGGQNGSAKLALTAQGDVYCTEPGPYREAGSRKELLAFQCVSSPQELPAPTAVAPKGRLVGESRAELALRPVRQYDAAFLFLALTLLLAEMWLVAGRYVRR